MMQKDVRNKPHRNGFDLSRRICFTNKTGLLTPVNYLEVLPGDTFDIDLNAFMRTIPVNTASFARVREYYDVFFVPYSLLWDKWNAFITQTNQPTHAASASAGAFLGEQHPYISALDLYTILDNISQESDVPKDEGGLHLDYSTWKLLHNLGYFPDPAKGMTPPVSGRIDVQLNPFPLLAYQKIYQDYFRFTQWENASPWTYNLDYMLTSSQRLLSIKEEIKTNLALLKNNYMTPRYCNYDKDLFFGIIPSPQYGEESMVSVSNTLPPQTYLFNGDARLQFKPVKLSGSSLLPLQVSEPVSSAGTSAVGNSAITGSVDHYFDSSRIYNYSQSNFLSSNLLSQFSVLAYRRAEASQKWKEITLSGDLDYVSQIQKHWGVTPPKTESYMCTRLGGCARNLDISEVLNSNLDTDTSFAEIKGKGILAQNGHFKWTNKSGQYGLIMVIHHVKPLIEWPQSFVFEKILTKTTADMYAIPEFDQIGNEPLFNYQFNSKSLFVSSQTVTPNSGQYVLGYTPRYAEYKTSFDIARGAFLQSQKNWILPYTSALQNILTGVTTPVTYASFKVSVDSTDPIFSVSSSSSTTADNDVSDPYLCSLYFKCHVVRNLDRDGLPY